MLYLNNELLTSERIISYFEKNLDELTKPSEDSNKPSLLKRFKNKLKGIFFEELGKNVLDAEIVHNLKTDPRFNSYPKLREILLTLFNFDDDELLREDGTLTQDLNQCLHDFKQMNLVDWQIRSNQFEIYNQRYGYFSEPISDELRHLFEELVISCRTMIVLFEKNNTFDDLIAYEYAYKLMALFVDPLNESTLNFDSLSRFTHGLMTKNVDRAMAHPFHDVLLVRLNPLPHANTLYDVAGWRALIKKEGMKAFPFLIMGQKIEQKMGELSGQIRAPDTLKQASDMAMLCHYNRAHEDLEFSKLCHAYKVPERRFDCCLDYLSSGWPKKADDLIPNLAISGVNEAEGLYWVKLPITDKRALILGDITDCCQSIDGNSEKCVKDAVSLRHNGLYVLVKTRKGNASDLIVKGQINDKDFKIIGQSYVWLSNTGNVCLDSIECLGGEVSNGALKSIISDFARQLLENFPEIHYVTIGRGGKTPVGFFEETKVSERMLEGYSYGDATLQYCIAKRSCLLEDNMRTELKQMFKGASSEMIDYLSLYLLPQSNGFFAALNQLALTHSSSLTSFSYNRDFILILIQLWKLNLLTMENAQKNFEAVVTRNYLPTIIDLLSYLQVTELLNDEPAQIYFNALIIHADPIKAARALFVLKEAGLLSDDFAQMNRDLVINHVNPEYMAEALKVLQEAGLLRGKAALANRDSVSKAREPIEAAHALGLFHQAGILNQEDAQSYRDAVIRVKDPINIAHALCILQNVRLLNSENAQANIRAVSMHAHPKLLVKALIRLQNENFLMGDFVAKDNFMSVMMHADPENVVSALIELQKANLLNDETASANRNAVCNAKSPLDVARALVRLQEAGLLSDEQDSANRYAVGCCANPCFLADVLIMLQKMGLLSGEQASSNRAKVISHLSIIELRRALRVFQEMDFSSPEIAQKNFDAMIDHPNFKAFVSALIRIQETNLLRGNMAQVNFEMMINHKNPEGVARALVVLQGANFLSDDQALMNRDLLIRHANFDGVVPVLEFLQKANLLSGSAVQENFDAVMRHNNLVKVCDSFRLYPRLFSGEEAQTNFNIVIRQENPRLIASILNIAQDIGFLYAEVAHMNRGLIENHRNLKDVQSALSLLQEAGLMSGDLALTNLDTVLRHGNIKDIVITLELLKKSGLFLGPDAQANFDAVTRHRNLSVLYTTCRKHFQSTKSLTQITFNGFIDDSSKQVKIAVVSYKNQLNDLQSKEVTPNISKNRLGG